MDLSKLPRLSQTSEQEHASTPAGQPTSPQPPATSIGQPIPAISTAHGFCQSCGAPLAPGVRFCGHCGAATGSVAVHATSEASGSAADAWISIAIGVILLFIYPYIPQWLFSKMSSSYQPSFLPITQGNTIIPYTQSLLYIDHLAVFAFAVVLIAEGILMFISRNVIAMTVAGTLTICAVLLNFYNIGNMMANGYAFPIFSGLAVAYGIYIAIHQFSLLRLAIATSRR